MRRWIMIAAMGIGIAVTITSIYLDNMRLVVAGVSFTLCSLILAVDRLEAEVEKLRKDITCI